MALADHFSGAVQEWRRITFDPAGVRCEALTSNWYAEERIARSLLNDEHPEPTSTGFRTGIETRWVTIPLAVDESRGE